LWTALSLLVAAAGAPPAEAVTVPGDFPTIQSAINAVVGGALPDGTGIDVQPGQYFEALVVANTARSLTVRSAGGAGAAIIDAFGRNTSTIMILNATGTIRFDGFVITGGVGPPGSGGGVSLVNASPMFSNCFIQGNTAPQGGGVLLSGASPVFESCTIQSNTAGVNGGGAVMVGGSRPTFMNSTIQNNASGLSSPFGSGGGIHAADASPTLVATRVLNNQSKFAGGGIVLLGAFGSPNGQATLVMTDSEVSGNQAVRDPGQNPAEGGGIHIETNALAQLTRVKVRNNVANTGGGLNSYLGHYQLTSSIIEGNQALDPLNVGGFGGGISAQSNNVVAPLRPGVTISLTDTVVRNNVARITGGIAVAGDQVCAGGPCDPATRATLTLASSLVQGNSAASTGGGIFTVRTNLTVTQSLILQNQVTGPTNSFGGGLILVDGTVAAIQDTTIAENSSQDLGGGLFIDGAGTDVMVNNANIYRNSAATRGGGIFVNFQGPPTGVVQNSRIADNTSGFQIGEQACPPLTPPIFSYLNNSITNVSTTDIYSSGCGGLNINNITTFNNLSPGSKTVGNDTSPPTFATFTATPDFAPSILAWSVARKTAISIDNGIGGVTAPTGTFQAFDAGTVTGVGPGTYTLTTTPPGITLNATVSTPPAPTVSPFDRDGRTDHTIYRSSTGQWIVTRSAGLMSTITWGDPALGDIPISGDFDGDGNGDIAVYRGTTGQWFVLLSSGGVIILTWGDPAQQDAPIAADFDGDGRADITVYRGLTGQWFVLRSGGGVTIVTWGDPSLLDLPVPADFDGDGRADFAVYRRVTGQWFVLLSGGGVIFLVWGDPAQQDVPVPGRYDGDGRADFAVYRRVTGQWFVLNSGGGATFLVWGDPALQDIPVPADYNGDGRTDIAVYRPADGNWFVLFLTAPSTLQIVNTGVPLAGDKAVPLRR
jgi:hypothetical protein